MNLIKQLQFDFRSGLTRVQYLIAIPIFLLSCLLAVTEIESYNICYSTLDLFLCSFAGSFPLFSDISEHELQIPTIWFLIINGCLYINLDYVASELAISGIQRMVRCSRRHTWFVSKCIWIIASCVLYIALALLVILIVQITMYGKVTYIPSIQVLNQLIKGITVHKYTITITDGVTIGVILPLLTLITYSILEFVLFMYTKPIISFMLGIVLQVIALCYQSPFLVGNGAMVVRSSVLVSNGVTPSEIVAITVGMNIILIVIGYFRFSQMDILEVGE